MRFEDYLKDCLKNDEFRKYWEEDELRDSVENQPVAENVSEVFEQLNKVYEEDSEYESESDFQQDFDSLMKNKGIRANSNSSASIEFYENDSGCPVADFLNGIQDEKLKEKTVRNIHILSQKGTAIREPLSSYVLDGIYELRTKQGGNIDRVFYFFVFGNKIILTNGYIKKSQKLDKKEFEKAKKYRDDYNNKVFGKTKRK